MINPFFSESYLSNLTNSSTVIYLEQSLGLEMNAFVREKLEEIVERFWEVEVDFVYLPALFESEAYGEVVEYHHPYVGGAWKELPLSAVYEAIGARFGVKGSANGLLVVESVDKALVGRFGTFSTEKTLMEQVEALVEVLRPRMEETLYYEMDDSINSDREERVLYRSDFISDEPMAYGSSLEADVEEMVRRLVERGSVKLIGRVIDELQRATSKVSRLFITNDYRIFLKDYGMKEVVMQPLAKCLFLLYLRHEEGIRFKQLSEYEDELLSIYREISLREKPDDVVESIQAMTNPLNNSVNEKCSRIRAAFLMLVAEELAEEYFITGRKGEVKRIRLDRGLVEFQ